jgi:uncharacterized protein (DUF433 family)
VHVSLNKSGDNRFAVGLVASGASFEEILHLYPYLESEDIRAAVAYAAWRSEERETPLQIV